MRDLKTCQYLIVEVFYQTCNDCACKSGYDYLFAFVLNNCSKVAFLFSKELFCTPIFWCGLTFIILSFPIIFVPVTNTTLSVNV